MPSGFAMQSEQLEIDTKNHSINKTLQLITLTFRNLESIFTN